MKTQKLSHQDLLKQLSDALSKYVMMEDQLIANRRRLKQKVPEIKNTLDTIKFLKEKEVKIGVLIA